ncbi:serine hydrolase [Dialister hominis]|uniref:serine hydrolase n=1 Tax=Dialister hominis TaxID=2582419 RepID=UPI003FF0EA07
MMHKIQEIFDKYINQFPGEFAAGWMDLCSNETCFVNEKKIMPTASICKIFILADILREIELGKIKWDDKIIMSPKKISPGSGILKLFHGGEELSLYDYAILMMSLSDNTAADILFSLCDKDEIREAILRPNLMNHTNCILTCNEMVSDFYGWKSGLDNRKFEKKNEAAVYDTNTWQSNYTTVSDLTGFLANAYHKKVVSPWVSNNLLTIMSKCLTNTRIPYYLPEDIRVSHKTGTMGQLVNDAGIVFAPKGDYILALFYDGNAADQEDSINLGNVHKYEQSLAELSRDIYSLYI